MSEWWDDFMTLMFKRAVLLSGEATDRAREVITRYLSILKWFTACGALALAAFAILLFGFAALNIQWGWLYPVLIALMTIVLLVMIFVALPVLWLLQGGYELLPRNLKEPLLAWQRRGGAILFGALITLVFINVFKLWQSPGRMLLALLILATFGVGLAIGWWRISDNVRKGIAVKLLISLFAIAILAKFPLVSEVTDWIGDRAEAAVFRATRPTPERYYPNSTDELREAFVHRGTGEFLIWYFRDERGNYEFYKSKGYDRLGRPLKQAETQREFDALVAWQSAKEFERETARRAKEEEAARTRALQEQERKAQQSRAISAYSQHLETARELFTAGDLDGAERAIRDADSTLASNRNVLNVDDLEAAQRSIRELRSEINAVRAEKRQIEEERLSAERAKEAERLRLASYINALPTEQVNYIVFLADSHGKPSAKLTSAIVERLGGEGIIAAGDVFSDRFISPTGFDAFFSGAGGADIAAMGINNVAHRLLLIRGGKPESSASGTVSRVRTYSMPMTISVIDTHNGTRLFNFVIDDITGAGVNEAAATSAFIERFADALAQRREVLDGSQ
ncbi:MAG TPA: hypothetical protein PK400_10200 [Phycisphaerales bacterium]|nr:hypothetical protein [Phycisphaerales bacterium]